MRSNAGTDEPECLSIYGAVGRFSITDFGNAAVQAQKSTPKPDHFLVAFDRQSAVTGERQ
jgi:hypothetical protein